LARGWNEQRDKAPAPQVWLPTSTLWLELLEQQHKADVISNPHPSSIATSVLSIAMPQEMAHLLQTNHPDGLGWSDILELATKGWKAEKAAPPEWGQFKLARDNPHTSTSGLAATIASFHAFISKYKNRQDITDADLNDPQILQGVHGV